MIRTIKIIRRIRAAAARTSITVLNDRRLLTISDRLRQLGADDMVIKQVKSVLGKRLKALFAELGRFRDTSWVRISPGWAKKSWFTTTPVYRLSDMPLVDEIIASSPICAYLVGA